MKLVLNLDAISDCFVHLNSRDGEGSGEYRKFWQVSERKSSQEQEGGFSLLS